MSVGTFAITNCASYFRTSLPVSEHVVVMGLPVDTRWCTLERLELDGTWTLVQPSNQIDAAHIDLMVHGTEGCWYRMTPCSASGGAYSPQEFYVPNTGSTVTTVVQY